MTYDELNVVFLIAKFYFAGAIIWISLTIVDTVTEDRPIGRFVHSIVKWYSRGLFAIYFITILFILALLWETKKY